MKVKVMVTRLPEVGSMDELQLIRWGTLRWVQRIARRVRTVGAYLTPDMDMETGVDLLRVFLDAGCSADFSPSEWQRLPVRRVP